MEVMVKKQDVHRAVSIDKMTVRVTVTVTVNLERAD